jgi:BolA protein
MNSRYERLRAILIARFSPEHLEIIDESAKHAGHAHPTERPTGGETHYRLLMVSDAFKGRPRLARSRSVHEALDTEFKTGLHAISLTLKTPAEVHEAKS